MPVFALLLLDHAELLGEYGDRDEALGALHLLVELEPQFHRVAGVWEIGENGQPVGAPLQPQLDL